MSDHKVYQVVLTKDYIFAVSPVKTKSGEIVHEIIGHFPRDPSKEIEDLALMMDPTKGWVGDIWKKPFFPYFKKPKPIELYYISLSSGGGSTLTGYYSETDVIPKIPVGITTSGGTGGMVIAGCSSIVSSSSGIWSTSGQAVPTSKT